ncbi:MAG: hypothetical protein QHH13_11360, partial [Melioribacter sp.]|nr:hypothetical protein [Melioribacter sp.]
MKQIVCIYNEGNDVKLTVMSKNNETVSVNRVVSITMTTALQSSSRQESLAELESIDSVSEISFDNIEKIDLGTEQSVDTSDIGQIQASLSGLNLKSLQFIPIVSEPIVSYHFYEGPKEENKKKLLQSIIADIENTKGITVPLDMIDVVEFSEKAMLSVFIEGEIAGATIVNQLASYNKRRYYKIP